MPDNLENLNSDTIIRKTSAKVNTSGQNFSGRYSVSAERPGRDENYVNNRLKSYTYSDVDKIVENLTINKYGREQKTSPQDTGGQPFGKKASGRAFISPNPFCAPADRPINSRKQLVYFCKGKIALVGI